MAALGTESADQGWIERVTCSYNLKSVLSHGLNEALLHSIFAEL